MTGEATTALRYGDMSPAKQVVTVSKLVMLWKMVMLLGRRQLCRVDGVAASPLRYDKMTPPYPAAAVRLAVLQVVPTAEQRTSILEGVAAVLAALPRGDSEYGSLVIAVSS